MKETNEDQLKNVNDTFKVPLPLINAEDIKILLSELLTEIQQSISKPAFETWFSFFSIEMIDNNVIVFKTDTKFKLEWIQTRFSNLILILLKKISGINFQMSFTTDEYNDKKSDNSPQKMSSAFAFLFEGKNNEYDIEYLDEIIVPTATIEERIYKLEMQNNILQIKDREKDQLIDFFKSVTTRLEAKINSIEKLMDKPVNLQNEE